jgi:hypothetical protein
MQAGVEVLPCRFNFELDQITWEGLQPVLAKEPSG